MTPAPAPSTPSAPSAPVSPSPPFRSAVWSLDLAARSGALKSDGSLAVVGPNDLYTVGRDFGVLTADLSLAGARDEIDALSVLDLPGGTLDGMAVRDGEVATVSATETQVFSQPGCPTPVAWTAPVGGSAVRFDPAENVYVIGVDASFQRSLTKLAAADGSVLWRVTFDDASDPVIRIRNGAFTGIDVDAAGAAYVAGTIESGHRIGPGGYEWTSMAAKVDAVGNVVWRFDGEFVRWSAIALDPVGDVRVAGRTISDGASDDLEIDSIASGGALRWRWLPTINPIDEIGRRLTGDPKIAVDAAGNVYATASVSEGGKGSLPTLVIALNGDAFGLWHGYATGSAESIAVDRSFRVFVTRDVGVTAWDDN